MKDFLTLDKKCSLPHLIPGDVMRTKKGNICIIDEAQTTVNGSKVQWNDDLPEKIEHGHFPSYSVQFLDPSCYEKTAWYSSDQFLTILKLSPIRNYLDMDDIRHG